MSDCRKGGRGGVRVQVDCMCLSREAVCGCVRERVDGCGKTQKVKTKRRTQRPVPFHPALGFVWLGQKMKGKTRERKRKKENETNSAFQDLICTVLVALSFALSVFTFFRSALLGVLVKRTQIGEAM